MKFSIKKSFKESWEMFFSKKIYLPFVLTSFVAVLSLYVSFGISGLIGTVFLLRGMWWLIIPIALIFLFFASYFILVSIYLPLETYKTKHVSFKKTFKHVWDWRLILKSLGLIFTIGLGTVLVGYLLSLVTSKIHPILTFVVVGVLVSWVAVRFAFSMYILVEKPKTGIIKTLKESHETMKGNGWKFLLFIITVTILSFVVQIISNQLGAISPILSQMVVILFGILIAPWFSLLTVSPYMQIKK